MTDESICCRNGVSAGVEGDRQGEGPKRHLGDGVTQDDGIVKVRKFGQEFIEDGISGIAIQNGLGISKT